ncbi:YciI family protein [Devosia aurantiaca]|uniref:YCII-related domain-containing protein n=1 Tax=Devosia aurantiaca TaxID=2714858 RepID=A0A6M1SFF1_9HYPH|nr:YciI family protein [Devosia aurantiaca]NGP18237.1 hypothetical protein [Devosia aurantiaca]
MKFLTMVKTLNPEVANNPPGELMQAIVQLGMEAGIRMTETGGMALAGTVTTRKGQLVTDGPYAEAKEMLGGYAIYDLPSEAEIVHWTERFVDLHRKLWPVWDGEVTILRLDAFNMAMAG